MSSDKDEEIFSRVPEIHPSEIEMETLIGEGSYGQVYSGKCRGKTVAIKVFKESMIKSEEDRQSIRDEVSIMSKIYHPNVVLFMGACTLPGNNLMIVTEKMPTDLETLLIQKKQQFSLFKKIKMLIDAALGMNWLHSSNPMFIHRDLKLSNLLVDQNFKVCVCDFGLTQAKPRDVSNLEYDPHGSPLYMAPEVFLGDYNEKCDVYSLGIVLWEMLVQKEAFEEVNQNLQTFVEAVCYNDFRPPIPQGIPQSLVDLMKRCWAKDPDTRPTMAEIISSLHEIAVEAAINDANGRKFWKQFFMEKDEVEWQEFKKGICEFLGIPLPPADDIQFKCLEAVTATKPQSLTITKGKVVHIEKFGQICSWFGPLKTNSDNLSMLNRIQNILGEKWFHGDITQDQSEDRLRDQLKGTFLIRFSSAPGYFTLSHLNKKGQVNHQRITYSDGQYTFWEEKYPTLLALLKDQRKKQNLVQPCPGSSYRKLFPREKHGKPVPQQDAGAYIAIAPKK